MDDTLLPLEAVQPCAPKLATPPEFDLPAGFVPMRLLLQPGGLCVDINKPQMIVGRHSEADVRLGLPDVSRRHCRFVFADDSWQVYDLNSLNGVFVNGERLHQAAIRHGDRIRIGSLTFEVDLGATVSVADDVRLPVRKAS
jgi:pSer/pThr/pTyr-binding forkhead associated (FHA) protein